MPTSRGSARSEWTRRLALVLGALAVGFALGEAGLRIAGIGYPVFYRADEHRGWALLPGADGRWDAEGGARVRINRDGLRDRDHPRARPPGTFRIAVLGDSFAAAFQLPERQAFWSVLERELAGCPGLGGRTPEVINFGVSNYGTAQELLTLRHHASAYAPDLVLLAVFTGNDVYNNSRRLNAGAAAPYFVLEDGELVLDDSFRRTARHRLRTSPPGRLGYRLVRSSRVLQLARQAVLSLRGRARAPEPGEVLPEAGLGAAVYREPTDPAWREAWEVTERLLALARDEARSIGAAFAVVTLSNPEQVHPDAARRAELARSLGVADLFYPERRIEQLGAREGFPVLALAPELQRHADGTGAYLHGFRNPGLGHWNESGHRLAGERIAAWLCAELAGSREEGPP